MRIRKREREGSGCEQGRAVSRAPRDRQELKRFTNILSPLIQQVAEKRDDLRPVMGKIKRPRRRPRITEIIIIPGLPNEVALIILVRLPRALHGIMRCVCSAWRDALQPSTVSALRNNLHISEIWALFFFKVQRSIYIGAVYDPLLPQLKSSPIRPCCGLCNCCYLEVLAVVGSQVFFWHKQASEGTDDILCFDAVSMQWQQNSIMPPFFREGWYGSASAVVDGHVYVVGGGEDKDEVCRFDVQSRTWEMMPSMHEGHLSATVVVLQGCLYVIGGYKRSGLWYKRSGSCEIWDPRTGEWMLEPKLCLPGADQIQYPPSAAVVMDTLYALIDWQLFCYKSESKVWTSLGYASPVPSRGDFKPLQLVGAGGDQLWVVFKCIPDIWPDCRTIYKIFSCMITDRGLSWTSIPTNSSITSKYRGELYPVYV